MAANFDIKDFQKEVIEASNRIPVIVDFWAEWCQPCKILGPILEELALQNKKNFKLAKVNTEEFTEIVREYGIQSIPAVKLFIDGKITAEFLGAQPKNAIEKWLKENIPDENQKELNEIKKQLQSGKISIYVKRLEKLVNKAPELKDARVILASYYVFNKPEKANELVKNIYQDYSLYDTVDAVKTYYEFISLSKRKKEIEDNNLKDKLFSAVESLKIQDFNKTFENLIFIIQVNKNYLNSIATKTCVALFNLLGNEHETTRLYRKKFDTALY